MYQEHVLRYKHLDEPLDEGSFVFECILAGNFQAFTTCSLTTSCCEALDCALHLFGLTIFLEILCFLLQNKLFIPSNL